MSDDASTKGPFPTPNQPVRAAEIRPEHWEVFEEGARFGSRFVRLGKLGGATQLGFNIDVIPPGKQSCPFHYHQREEEHFYILEGRCVLRTGDDRHEMGPGDYVCFPARTGVAHCFENPFDAECRLISVGPFDPDEVCVYPDSGKVLIRSLGKMAPAPESSLDYFHGEPADEPLSRRGGA
jgi:uncharacterized cupin superfamily protein